MIELIGFLICLLLFFVIAGLVEQGQSKRKDIQEYRAHVRGDISGDANKHIRGNWSWEGRRLL